MLAHVIGLDQYGYVYVHGISDSPAFSGRVSPLPKVWAWVHGKTHWDLAGEYEYDFTTNGFANFPLYTVETAGNPPTFMSKGFVVPRKFRNIPLVPPTTAPEVVTFGYVYSSVTSPISLNGYLVNEVSYLSTLTYNSFGLTNKIWGYFYVKSTRNSDLHIYKSKSIAATSPYTYK